MKLKKFAAAAVAMVMAVSMLSVPVWAADTQGEGEKVTNVGTNVSSNLTNGSASTNVNVIYSNSSSQLSVTVPIAITFAVKNDKTFICPSDDAYNIVNNSVVPVHVTTVNVATVENNGDYTLVSDTDFNTASGNVAKLKMQNGTDTDSLELTASDTNGTALDITPANWNLAATGDTSGKNKLTLKFSDGAVNNVDAKWVNSTETTLFKITYTVAAGTDIQNATPANN